MMIKTEKADCSGCTACAVLCPKNAITMKNDPMGFLYPEINDGVCTGCGLCEKRCPFHAAFKTDANFEKPFVYAARHKNRQELEIFRFPPKEYMWNSLIYEFMTAELASIGDSCTIRFPLIRRSTHEENIKYKSKGFYNRGIDHFFPESKKKNICCISYIYIN